MLIFALFVATSTSSAGELTTEIKPGSIPCPPEFMTEVNATVTSLTESTRKLKDAMIGLREGKITKADFRLALDAQVETNRKCQSFEAKWGSIVCHGKNLKADQANLSAATVIVKQACDISRDRYDRMSRDPKYTN